MRVVIRGLAAVLLEFPAALQAAHSLASECRSGLQTARRCCLFDALRPRTRTGRAFNFRRDANKTKSPPARGELFVLLVETAGIEPASASPLQIVLHT